MDARWLRRPRDEIKHGRFAYQAYSAEGAAGDAAIRGESEWGQGERGAAGYEDSGGSELDFETEREQVVLSPEERETISIEEPAP